MSYKQLRYANTVSSSKDGKQSENKCFSKNGNEIKVVSLSDQLFCKNDIIDAIHKTNFKKALGVDGFDGTTLLQNDQIKENFISFAL